MTQDLREAVEAQIAEWREEGEQLLHEGTDQGLKNDYIRGRGAERAKAAYELEELLQEHTDE